MVYASLKFMEDYVSTVGTRQVTFKQGEVYTVDVLDERGRTADFRFMTVPEGSEVKAGEVGKNINTAILAVNMGSYWEHKAAKVKQAEEN